MISPKNKILFLNLDYNHHLVSIKDTMGGLGEIYSHKFKMPIMDFIIGATIFYNNRYNITVIDNELDKISDKKLIKDIKNNKYNIVFIRTSLPTIERDLLFIDELKKSAHNTKVCIFAPHLSQIQKFLNKRKIDFFISGEAEFVFLDIVNQLPIFKTKGLAFRKNKELVYNGDRGHNNDLNLLPVPKWDLVDYKKYPFIICLTSKGCPYNCAYCPYPVYQGLKWRARDVEIVINELKELYFKYKINFIRFRDPEFTMNKNRTIEICRGIIKYKIKINWVCETRLDLLDKELLTIMKESRCVRVCFGIESINDKTCKIVNRKKIDTKKIENILNICADLGIETSGFFIIGLPGETKKTILELINFSLILNSDFNDFTLATPYPGTRLREWAKERNLLINRDNYNLYTGRHIVMTNGILNADQLKVLHRFANLANRQKRRKLAIKKDILNRFIKAPFKIKDIIKKDTIKLILYYYIKSVTYYYLKIKVKYFL